MREGEGREGEGREAGNYRSYTHTLYEIVRGGEKGERKRGTLVISRG